MALKRRDSEQLPRFFLNFPSLSFGDPVETYVRPLARFGALSPWVTRKAATRRESYAARLSSIVQ